ncbi:MAG: alanine racemase [Candidatus Cloacimonetes bacterium]|nr:alanine racemase [Candidatus Cloacimonadota bacterium]
MCTKTRRMGLELRPHFKTHQSRIIGSWFRDTGINKITVSSLQMAAYFADDGWEDITVAFPVNHREINLINDLAARINLGILCVDPLNLEFLNKKLHNPANFWIEIDIDSQRSGLSPENLITIQSMIKMADPGLLRFRGFLSHAGKTYSASTVDEVVAIHRREVKELNNLASNFRRFSTHLEISVGDTPGCVMADEFPGITEIRPGNFVFFDLMQAEKGICRYNQIAIALACPVVAVYPPRGELVVYGGAIHLSKDFLINEHNVFFYGKPVNLTESGWSEPYPESAVVRLAQEHGVIQLKPEFLKKYRIGDIIGILPVHTCLTAQAMGSYQTLTGEKIDHM